MKGFKIGKILKEERLKLKLTQSEFIQGVLSVSQYSRIESCEQDIKASDLIKILTNNQIDLANFFDNIQSQINNGELSNSYIFSQIVSGYYERDLPKLVKLQDEIKDKRIDKTLKLRLKIAIAILNNDVNQISAGTKKELLTELNKSDDWTEDKNFLQLFGNSMAIFSMENLNIYMRKILRTYVSTIDKRSVEMQKRIAGVCINYLTKSHMEKDTQMVAETLKLLSNLSENPELLMYKMLGLYYKDLFTGNREGLNKILSLLREAGYTDFIKNLPR